MKKVSIPLIDKVVYIYVGEEEFLKFKNQLAKLDYDFKGDCPQDSGDGLTWGGFIWIYDLHNLATLFHEMQHCMDNVFRDLGSSSEMEFKAHITGYTLDKVLRWYISENIKEFNMMNNIENKQDLKKVIMGFLK